MLIVIIKGEVKLFLIKNRMALKHAKLQSLQDAYNTKAAAFHINVSKDKTRIVQNVTWGEPYTKES